MPIQDFASLFQEALEGNVKALDKWHKYSANKEFDQNEINSVLTFNVDDTSEQTRSYYLFLRAVWNQHGIGSDVNYPETIKLYEEAINLDNAHAMNNRAHMHQNGLGGEQNYPEAINLYKKAIELDHASAMNHLAYLFRHGKGCEQNDFAAIELYQRAIALGNTYAMYNRAHMHQKGLGGAVNYSEAITLYNEAIKLGNTHAMCERAYMHQNGLGGNVNYIEAIKLCENATNLGNTDAKKARDSLRRTFTESTTLKIDKILTDLKQKIGDEAQHHFQKAQGTAKILLDELKVAKKNYLINLNNSDMSIVEANQDFESACKTSIEKASTVLKNDLDWSTYLNNLLKRITNAVILVLSFGQANNFFKQKNAQSMDIVAEAERELKPV